MTTSPDTTTMWFLTTPGADPMVLGETFPIALRRLDLMADIADEDDTTDTYWVSIDTEREIASFTVLLTGGAVIASLLQPLPARTQP